VLTLKERDQLIAAIEVMSVPIKYSGGDLVIKDSIIKLVEVFTVDIE
jgi:hypothetical protein